MDPELTSFYPENRISSMYLTEADKVDKALMESWTGDMDGILIFVRSPLLYLVLATHIVPPGRSLLGSYYCFHH